MPKNQVYDGQKVTVTQFDFSRLDFLHKACLSSKGVLLDTSIVSPSILDDQEPFSVLAKSKHAHDEDSYLDIMFRHLLHQEESRVLRIH